MNHNNYGEQVAVFKGDTRKYGFKDYMVSKYEFMKHGEDEWIVDYFEFRSLLPRMIQG